ncbi:hypothetical protein K466DRAFT_583251 [Polyporus arcularius HHB13444]|uniref:DUF6533 domain-containing protein n=1 Tax=Polyporus arcularius HHB13444 TaxID=1314778 RepID=A0A5C3PN37_9APHY|nr:hypothetical protein K466DRAFT_583251 [Polyporus arcularius HHB13444]
MSSDADAAAATVSLFDSIYTGRYCNMAASALFFYDATITFDREVACYWASKQTGAAVLFLANKWISMTLYVMTLISFASFPTDQSCSVLQNANQALVILQFVPGAVFSALRAYVLSRNKLLGIFVLALSLAPVGSNLVEYGRQLSGGNLPPFGCLYTDNMTQAIELKFGSQKP